jgi:DNA modification methylase
MHGLGAAGPTLDDGSERSKHPAWREQARRALATYPPEGWAEKNLLLLPYRVADALQQDGWFLRSTIVWVKRHAHIDSADDRPRRIHEPVFLLTKRSSGYTFRMRPEGATDVWQITPARGTDSHSSMMPLELARRCLEIGSPPHGRVLDPFGGLGTTALAAHACGRQATLIEINPTYARQSKARLQATE